jgi:hypothetical protein
MGAMQTILGLLAQDAIPRLYTKLASLARSTIHITVAHELTSNSMFAKRAIPFANSPFLQSAPDVTTLLGISGAPTSVVRGRAQKKNVRSRAQEMSRLPKTLKK